MSVTADVYELGLADQKSEDFPHISVDRTLGHLFKDFELNLEHLRHFYELLPHTDRLPFSEVAVHFSATTLVGDKNLVKLGRIAWEGTDKLIHDVCPELPKTKVATIIIFVGTLISEYATGQADDTTTIGEYISLGLTHELTHYAQGRKKRGFLRRSRSGHQEQREEEAREHEQVIPQLLVLASSTRNMQALGHFIIREGTDYEVMNTKTNEEHRELAMTSRR